jgi:hypothetical protein
MYCIVYEMWLIITFEIWFQIIITYTWAISWAIMKADVKPSSLITAQLLAGLHIPVIGA